MIDLIRKRHEGPAWVVVPEVPNGTGSNVSRRADAIALGLWPSRGYEIHGYEVKVSRGDVRKELNDPSKADAVGRFCDYWWLVVEDLSIIDGLVVPSTWGILAPKLGVLRVHRKAPKLKAAPVTRSFVAALTRKVTESWIPRDEHETYKKVAKEELRKEIERDRAYVSSDIERERDVLLATITHFQEVSGVDLKDGNTYGAARWTIENIGEAVKAVRDFREKQGRAGAEVVNLVRQQLYSAERAVEAHENAALEARNRMASIVAQLKQMGPQPE